MIDLQKFRALVREHEEALNRDYDGIPEETHNAVNGLAELVEALEDTPEVKYEYAVRTLLITNQYSTREQAENFMRVLDGINPNARLVRRVVAGPWEEFK